MTLKAICCIYFLLILSKIKINIFTEFPTHVDILSLELIAVLSAKTSWWMMHSIHAQAHDQVFVWYSEFRELLKGKRNLISSQLLWSHHCVIHVFELEFSMIFHLLILVAMVAPLAQSSHCLGVLGIRCYVICSLVVGFGKELTFVCRFVFQILVWYLVTILPSLSDWFSTAWLSQICWVLVSVIVQTNLATGNLLTLSATLSISNLLS